jgi:hypothetical protein
MGDDRVVAGLVTRARNGREMRSAVAAVITLSPVPATPPARGHVSGMAQPGWEGPAGCRRAASYGPVADGHGARSRGVLFT